MAMYGNDGSFRPVAAKKSGNAVCMARRYAVFLDYYIVRNAGFGRSAASTVSSSNPLSLLLGKS